MFSEQLHTNLSKQEKEKLINILEKIKIEKDLPLEQRTIEDKDINEIISFIKDKKYGLYFEKHIEQVDIDCEKNFLGFVEDVDKKIEVDKSLPYNFLLEGDNLHSLKLLEKTHIKNGKGLIDVIYIDPPYNTGNKDFKYNDKIVDSEDGYRHSKWLSFMQARLEIAYNLLSDYGVIFISIDDNEFANLKLLCDEVFGEDNFITNGFVLDNLKGKSNDNFITNVGHKILIYTKDKEFINKKGGFQKVENVYGNTTQSKYKYEDNKSEYNEISFRKSGQEKYREDRGTMYYPILYKENKFYSITDEEYSQIYDRETKKFNDEYVEFLKEKYTKLNYEFILPINELGELVRWTSSFNQGYKKLINNNDLIYKNGNIYEKKRPDEKELLQLYANGVCKSLFYKKSYANGTKNLEDIIGKNNFSFPKPQTLIKDLLKLIYNKDAIVLDFFAGSGTTGHAVLELNKEEGGIRKFILCTNNENNICEDITYQRLKTVITGIRQDGSKYSDGLPSNLKYFKTTLVDKNDDDLEDELLDSCIPLIELENAMEVGEKTKIVFNDEELENVMNNLPNIETIYIVYDVLLTSKQKDILKKNNIEIKELPKYYFDEI